MRRVVPDGGDEALDEVYADLEVPDGRWVVAGMVTSLDGAIAVDGRSAGLGGDGDLAGFRAARALADVVVVGARTASEERYRGTWPARRVEQRRARGQDPLPVLALVTRSGTVDDSMPALAGEDPDRLPLVLTGGDVAPRLGEELEGRAEVLAVPLDPAADGLDLGALLDLLAGRGLRRVVCEGGPTLLGALVARGLVEELLVTIAPTLVGRGGPGIVGGALPRAVGLSLLELRVHGSELLARYRLGDATGDEIAHTDAGAGT